MVKAPKGIPFRRHYINGKRVIYPLVEKWLKEEFLPPNDLTWEEWMHYVDWEKQEGLADSFKSFNVNPKGLGKDHLEKLKLDVLIHVSCAAHNKRVEK